MSNIMSDSDHAWAQRLKTSRSMGILMIVLGALAILYPLFATIFSFNVIGFVLLLLSQLTSSILYGVSNVSLICGNSGTMLSVRLNLKAIIFLILAAEH